MMYDPVVEEPMPMMMETSVTRQSAINRFPCEKSISTAENLRPSPARMMPPMMTPRVPMAAPAEVLLWAPPTSPFRSEEHTSELQSLMRISYAVFCLKKKKAKRTTKKNIKQDTNNA